MISKLLATTALATLLASGALAQSTSVDTSVDGPIFNSETQTEMMKSSNGYFEANSNQILASDLLGKTIYTSSQEGADAIGDVNDVVVAPNGMAQAVVVGVGGFLGIGEKEVAVEFARLNWVERDGDRILTMTTTADELKSAPEFDRTIVVGTAEDGMTGIRNPEVTPKDQAVAEPMEQDKPMDMAASEPKDPALAPPMDNMETMDTAEANADGMTMVEPSTLTAEELIGARVLGASEKDLGEVGDVVLTVDGQVEAYIIDVGGFLGLGEKPVALEAEELDVMKNADGDLVIYTSFTEDELKSKPAYKKTEAS